MVVDGGSEVLVYHSSLDDCNSPNAMTYLPYLYLVDGSGSGVYYYCVRKMLLENGLLRADVILR